MWCCVQGDEPFDTESLMKLIEIFRKDATGQVDLASLMREKMKRSSTIPIT
jgi:3-deoxy-manno-octulosonate cytidylyltransferase (CMP-KDO synthetase)